MAYRYYQCYSDRNETAISVRCSRRQKKKFDEVCEILNKSKTEMVLSYIDELYRKHVIGEGKE